VGDLCCLDLATGALRWTTNLVGHRPAKELTWGLSSSPLVLEGRVIVAPLGRRPAASLVALVSGAGDGEIKVWDVAYRKCLWSVRAHQGMDYAAARGTPVRALGDGVVIFAGWKGGYGRVLEIRHKNGLVTRYGHLNGFAAGIRRGTSVSISRTVAFVGTTGLSTAPHLHFEVLVNGKHRDPRVALRNVTGEPLAAAHRASFADLKARLFARLDGALAAQTVAGPVGTRVAGD
jgi:murein DD-endopeptidase MepM/ murein hydrolase activator NlpD